MLFAPAMRFSYLLCGFVVYNGYSGYGVVGFYAFLLLKRYCRTSIYNFYIEEVYRKSYVMDFFRIFRQRKKEFEALEKPPL